VEDSLKLDQHSDAPGSRHVGQAFTLALLIAASGVVGLIPSAVYFQSRTFFVFVIAEGALVSFLYLLRKTEQTSYRFGRLECFLASLASVSVWGFLGVVWLSFYKIFYWLAKLVGLVFQRVADNADSISFAISAVLCALAALGVALAIVESIARRFLSVTASSRTAYYSRALREQTRTYFYSFLSLVGLVLMAGLLWFFGGQRAFWIYFLVQFIPYMSTFWLLNLGSRSRNDSEVFLAVVKLLRLRGYRVVISPHSANSIVDRLLSGVDLIAFNDTQALFVKVKTGSGSTEPVEWEVGSSLKLKVRALQSRDFDQSSDINYFLDKHIQPLMILCGREAADTLNAFSHEESVPIVTVTMAEIDRILEGDDDEAMKIAAQHLGFLEADAKPLSGSLAVQGGNQWA
jgi:hypothetical protein